MGNSRRDILARKDRFVISGSVLVKRIALGISYGTDVLVNAADIASSETTGKCQQALSPPEVPSTVPKNGLIPNRLRALPPAFRLRQIPLSLARQRLPL